MGVNDRERFFGDRRSEQRRSPARRAVDTTRELAPPSNREHGREQRQGDERGGKSTIRTVSGVAELTRHGGAADPLASKRGRRSHRDGWRSGPARPPRADRRRHGRR
jgi:hypothetical protein